MTSEAKRRGSGLSSKGSAPNISAPWSLASGVNQENYCAFARECFRAKGAAFLIALANGKSQGVEYHYSAKQWGAWLAFFKRAKIKHSLMLHREWYQVPTEWPHEFTADSTVQQDFELGEEFERRWLVDRASERAAYARGAERAAQAVAAKARMRKWSGATVATPEEHLKAPAPEPSWRAGGSEEFKQMVKDIGQF